VYERTTRAQTIAKVEETMLKDQRVGALRDDPCQQDLHCYLRGAVGEFYDSGIKITACKNAWRLCRKIVESLSFPKMYYSMPIKMFFVVKIH
jgi:hypothetical protein